MIIGFTGSQSGMTNFQKTELARLLRDYSCDEFVHGDCIGSDSEANDVAVENGAKFLTIFPPDVNSKRAWCFNPGKLNRTWMWQQHFHDCDLVNPAGWVVQVRWAPPKPFLERNQRIVDHSQMLIATPKEFEHTLRSGTWATIRYAWKREKKDPSYKVVVIPPVVRED